MTQHVKNDLVFYTSPGDKPPWWVLASCSCGWHQAAVRNSQNIMLDTSEEDVNRAWVEHFIKTGAGLTG